MDSFPPGGGTQRQAAAGVTVPGGDGSGLRPASHHPADKGGDSGEERFSDAHDGSSLRKCKRQKCFHSRSQTRAFSAGPEQPEPALRRREGCHARGAVLHEQSRAWAAGPGVLQKEALLTKADSLRPAIICLLRSLMGSLRGIQKN